MNKLDDYIVAHTEPEDELLHEIDRQTHLQTLFPNMLSGHLQGKVLTMLSFMIKPLNILEIGTFTAYSSICLARGLCEGGKLYTIEVDDEMEPMARNFIERSGLQSSIEMLIGDARQLIPNLHNEFDLVFIDGDKTQYIDYYNIVFDKVKKGGYIIADNVLWYGKVVEQIENNDTYTKGILAFNDFVHNDIRVENVIFPIRDGLMVMRKK